MGRIVDAVGILAGGRTVYERRMRRMETELSEVLADAASAMEKLNAWAARVAKRESRAAAKAIEDLAAPEDAPGPPISEAVGVALPRDRKAELRARAAASGLLAIPPAIQKRINRRDGNVVVDQSGAVRDPGSGPCG